MSAKYCFINAISYFPPLNNIVLPSIILIPSLLLQKVVAVPKIALHTSYPITPYKFAVPKIALHTSYPITLYKIAVPKIALQTSYPITPYKIAIPKKGQYTTALWFSSKYLSVYHRCISLTYDLSSSSHIHNKS